MYATVVAIFVMGSLLVSLSRVYGIANARKKAEYVKNEKIPGVVAKLSDSTIQANNMARYANIYIIDLFIIFVLGSFVSMNKVRMKGAIYAMPLSGLKEKNRERAMQAWVALCL